MLSMALSVLDLDLMKSIQGSYENDPLVKETIEALKKKHDAKNHFTWSRGILRRKSKLVIPMDVELRNNILWWLHESGSGGHSG